jgi:capsid portal protein
MTDYIDMIDINGIWFNEFPDDSSYQFMQINVVSFVEGL